VASDLTSEDAVLVLQADKVISIEIEKFSSTFIGRAIILPNFEPYPFGILIARLRIIHWNREKTIISEFRRHRGTEICCERSNTTLSREIIPDECDARW